MSWAARSIDKILIVDASAAGRAILRRMLRALGHPGARYREAGDGRAALDAIRLDAPDLILTELNLPELSGAAMIGHIRADRGLQHIPVIVVSSLLNDARRKELEAHGVESMIPKPLSGPLLAAELERVSEWGVS